MKNIEKLFIYLTICAFLAIPFAKAGDYNVYEGSDFSFEISIEGLSDFDNVTLELKTDYNWIEYEVADDEIEVKGTAPILGTEFSEDYRDFEFTLKGYNKTNQTQVLFNETHTLIVKRVLRISEVTVDVTFINGDSDDEELTNGERFEVKPYSDVEFSIEVENNNDKDFDLEDVYAELIIYDIDDGDDLEYESDEKDIREGRTSTFKINTKIPLLVDEDSYDVELIVYGEDEYGREYSVKKTYELQVEKDRYEIYISNLEVFPDKISCSGYAELTGTVYNIGSRDIDLQITATNSDLDLKYSEIVILSEDPFDEENKFRISIPIRIEDAQETTRNTISFYFKGLDRADSIYELRDVVLDVEKCPQQEQETEENNNDEDIIIVTPSKDTNDDNNQTPESEIPTEEESEDSGKKEIIIYEQPFVESPAFIAMLAMILGLLVILLIIVLFLLKKK